MNLKKTLLTTLVLFIISNVLTTIWYMLTDEANYVPYRREEIDYLAMMLNHLIYAGLFVYLFPYYYERYQTLGKGFLYGALMAAVMYLPQALVIRGIWTVDINLIFFLNSAAHLAIGGVMGLVAGIMYKK